MTPYIETIETVRASLILLSTYMDDNIEGHNNPPLWFSSTAYIIKVMIALLSQPITEESGGKLFFVQKFFHRVFTESLSDIEKVGIPEIEKEPEPEYPEEYKDWLNNG